MTARVCARWTGFRDRCGGGDCRVVARESAGRGRAAGPIAGSLDSMFDFHGHGDPKLFLDPDAGQPLSPGMP